MELKINKYISNVGFKIFNAVGNDFRALGNDAFFMMH